MIHLLQGSGTYLRHISSSLSPLKATRPSVSVQVLHNMAHFSSKGAQMGRILPQLSYLRGMGTMHTWRGLPHLACAAVCMQPRCSKGQRQ